MLIPDHYCYLNRSVPLRGAIALPPLPLARLGNQHFLRDTGLALPYLCGSMADGISSVDLVTAIGKAGMLGDRKSVV